MCVRCLQLGVIKYILIFLLGLMLLFFLGRLFQLKTYDSSVVHPASLYDQRYIPSIFGQTI